MLVGLFVVSVVSVCLSVLVGLVVLLWGVAFGCSLFWSSIELIFFFFFSLKGEITFE